MGHDEIHLAECGLGIGTVAEGNLGGLLLEQDPACLGDDFLAGTIVVVELDLLERETMLVLEQHEDDTRCESAAAAGDDYREFFHDHDSVTKEED